MFGDAPQHSERLTVNHEMFCTQAAEIRHNVRMGARVAAALIVFAGCGAKLEDSPTDASLSDARRSLDATRLIDAPPVDARPCAGGTARATDPTTGSCFVYFIGPATYTAAETACTAFTAKLAVIKSAATNATVLSLIGLNDAFIGGTDSAVEGTFTWLRDPLDPITVGVGYTNWRTGEPNNQGGTNPDGEDCMIIEGSRMGTWDDRACAPPPLGAGSYPYVCQY